MALAQETDALTKTVLENLEFQHDWTALKQHSHSDLPRNVIFGLPPRRLYTHPDEQIEIIKAEKNRTEPIPQPPEFEWVLPLHLSEKWTVERFAAVFDALEAAPPGALDDQAAVQDADQARFMQWRGPKRSKRVLLATVQDDSTVVYYFLHQGIVKPRQN